MLLSLQLKSELIATQSQWNHAKLKKMMGDYQLDDDDAYIFGRDRQYAFFQSPFQAYEWATAEVLFADIDYTGCSHFKYLYNVVC